MSRSSFPPTQTWNHPRHRRGRNQCRAASASVLVIRHGLRRQLLPARVASGNIAGAAGDPLPNPTGSATPTRRGALTAGSPRPRRRGLRRSRTRWPAVATPRPVRACARRPAGDRSADRARTLRICCTATSYSSASGQRRLNQTSRRQLTSQDAPPCCLAPSSHRVGQSIVFRHSFLVQVGAPAGGAHRQMQPRASAGGHAACRSVPGRRALTGHTPLPRGQWRSSACIKYDLGFAPDHALEFGCQTQMLPRNV